MKKNITLLLFIFMLTSSCKNYLYNLAFEKVGMYEESIDLLKVENTLGREVLFFPMIHVSTPQFYDDVRFKIDSLKQQDYIFYYENVTRSDNDTLKVKMNQLLGFNIQDGGTYLKKIDSIVKAKNVKLKKQVIDQPKYSSLGLDSINSVNVDASFKEIIAFYESNFGEIKLKECHFQEENKNCPALEINTKHRDSAIVHFRNTVVVNNISQNNHHRKIAVIYGIKHVDGMKKELASLGFYPSN